MNRVAFTYARYRFGNCLKKRKVAKAFQAVFRTSGVKPASSIGSENQLFERGKPTVDADKRYDRQMQNLGNWMIVKLDHNPLPIWHLAHGQNRKRNICFRLEIYSVGVAVRFLGRALDLISASI